MFVANPPQQHSCLASAWPSSSGWPNPSAFCNHNAASSCLTQACSATPAAYSSFSLISASLCNQYQSCAAAGSTGVYTITASGPWGPGWGAGGPGGPGGPGHHWGGPSATWGAGVYTVTGCPWSGSPWFGGASGTNWNGWGPTGTGWTWYTQMSTITTTFTSNGFVVTSTGVATVGEAVSNGFTSLVTYGVGATSNPAAARPTGDVGVKAMGAMLGGVVAVAAML